MLERLFPIALGMLASLLDEGPDPKRPFSPPSALRAVPELSGHAIHWILSIVRTAHCAMMIILLARGEVLESSPLTAHQTRAQR